ncbi:MAG: NADH-quinone oxidoreductase subunit L [Methanothrix sp.]|nr:NADH-quinone oxidoreductase subunit L [Methanothrix sp.]
MPGVWIILTIGLPWFGALAVLLVGNRRVNAQHGLAVAFSLAAAACGLILVFNTGEQSIVSLPVGGVFGDFTFLADGLGVFLAAVATVVGCLAVIFSVDYMKGEHQIGRYYAFVLFFIGGMAGLVLTSSLLLMFVFWEITALCSYALIAFHNDDPKAVAGGIKALIITQFGGIGLLGGALLLFVYQGNYDIQFFLAHPGGIPADVLVWMAFGCLAAAAAKSAQFPFQTWLPDAMEAPTPISALIHAATMVNAGVYLLARFYPAFADVPVWREAVIVVGMLSAFLAAVMALVANDLKRVLAYSTVSQLGYMVFAVGAGGVFASQFHLMSHSIFKALLFLSAGAVIHSIGTRDMREMGGLGKQMPLVRAVFLIGALALMGIPVLNGFWSKELVLESGLTFGTEHGMVWAYGVMVLVAGLTALYTARCLWMVFYGPRRSEQHVHDAGPAMRVALIPLAVGTLMSWLLADPFLRLLETVPSFHRLLGKAESGWELLLEVIKAPATLLALAVIGLGLLTWRVRKNFGWLSQGLKGIGKAAADGFGFEAINRGIVQGFQSGAETLRGTQTGMLSWNIVGLVAGFVIVLMVLILGG